MGIPVGNINPLLWSEYKVYKVKKCGYIELDIQWKGGKRV